ncbi:MAG: thioredoxin [Deltaproteobacteria bacterium]|jgi:thioredoxin 1|nr:thioredoxin [Deltaproteobacteria bacterium]
MAEIKVLTNETFSQAIAAEKIPVLVDFWAPWCGPCMTAAPIMEELCQELAGKLDFAKINVDEHQNPAVEFKITSIPCFIVFKGGQEIKRIVGLKKKEDYLKQLERLG